MSDHPAGEESSWRETLAELGVRPSKALGQNFLHDQKIVRRIADAAEIAGDELVVEIGPGLGILTRELAARAAAVIAVELDRRLAAHLRQRFEGSNVRVIEADALTLDLGQLTGGRPYAVVANLPYSVAAAVIRHLLEGEARPEWLVVMVQREVAERIVAKPPAMSILAVAVQFFGQPRIMFRLGGGAFIPPPRVESAVLRIDVRSEVQLDGLDRRGFFRLIQAGFGQRRKRLGNAVSDGLRAAKPEVEARLRAAGVDPGRRAETLSIPEWLRAFEELRDLIHADA